MISRSSFFIKIDLSTPMLIVKVIENNTMYSAQELHFFLCSVNIIQAIFDPLTI